MADKIKTDKQPKPEEYTTDDAKKDEELVAVEHPLAPEFKKTHGKKYDWDKIRNFYFNRKLPPTKEADNYTMKMLAHHFLKEYPTLKYAQVRSRASQEDWTGLIAQMKAKKLESSIDQLNEDMDVEFNEIKTRKRHIRVGRFATATGMKRIEMVKPRDLTVNQAIKLVELGVDLERMSAGIKEDKSTDLLARLDTDKSTTEEYYEEQDRVAIGTLFGKYGAAKVAEAKTVKDQEDYEDGSIEADVGSGDSDVPSEDK